MAGRPRLPASPTTPLEMTAFVRALPAVTARPLAAADGRRCVAAGAPARAAACQRSRPHGLSMVAAGKGPARAKSDSSGRKPFVNDGYCSVPTERIRNLSIIAHIDHGKSTLADRLIQATDAVGDRDMKAQLLDNMDLERERGITIKLQAVRLNYLHPADGLVYAINLIDTPGHVDFSYEVSRSLMACEGALLVVDATQGVEAQTLANTYIAMENNLEIIPVINKIDMASAEPDRVVREVEEVVGIDCTNAVMASAKSGIGIEEILSHIVEFITPPQERAAENLRALIFDSAYDPYRGVVVYFRVMDGVIKKGSKVRFMATGRDFEVDEIGVLSPRMVPVEQLSCGEVGYLIAGIKTVEDARVGDTITTVRSPAPEALPGYEEAKPMVFSGVFPSDASQFNALKDALQKLKLNDAALSFEAENSSAMGFGFRCGFLGLLHLDVVQERLEREYDLDIITTAPSVVYRVKPTKGDAFLVDNPADLPDPTRREYIEEPYVRLEMITPEEFVGPIMELSQSRRGEFVDMRFLVQGRTTLVYELPLAELVTDFFDCIKSRSKGYASMEYSLSGYRKNKLVKMDVCVNGELIEPLSCILHEDNAYDVGKDLTKKLKEIIPRAQFKIPIQAMIGARVVASSTISALRTDVLAKCYGGDISRKRKLLDKQKKGKKRLRQFGKVNMPQEAFMAIVSVDRSSPSSARN